MASKAKDVITEVGGHEWTWVPQHRLLNLRRFVDVRLAQQGINHTQAAKRAGVSKSHWSNIVNGERITETDLKVVARGLRVKFATIVTELSTEEEAA